MTTILMRRLKRYSMVTIVCCVTVLVSCSDWDEFKKYTEEGEIVYPGKFDTVAVFPGNGRVKVWGKLTADPKVKKVRMFWDNKQDSVEFPIENAGSDFIFDQVVNVEEGTKSFTLYTYDEFNNQSVGITVQGVSYGQRYRNTLSNRRIKSIAYDEAATTIYWDIIDPKLGPVSMEVTYETLSGKVVIVTQAAETTTVLQGLDYENNGFTWRTIYKPLPQDEDKLLIPIDTFNTPSSVRSVPTFVEKELDRSLFREAFYAGDVGPNGGGSGGIDAMWDGLAQNNYNFVSFTDIGAGGSSPQMITFDLGLKVQASKLVIYPFQEHWGSYYVFSTIREYEIYGSANPSSGGALDGTWTLLTSGTLEKPSGLGRDIENAADQAAAIAGFTLDLNPAAPKVRYIRIRCLKNYESLYFSNNNAFFSVAEVRVFGMQPE